MNKPNTMKNFFVRLSLLVFILTTSVNAQYTEVINSNRPGLSYSAFSVGRNVVQGELGLFYEKLKHSTQNTEQKQFGFDFAVRYGLLLEQLEIIWDGSFAFEKYINNAVIPSSTEKRNNFLRHTLGAKYLVYDPFKKNRDSINIRSWKANHGLKWKNLIPAVSVYAGAHFNFGDNPFAPNDPTVSPKVMVATQSHLLPRLVFVTNIMYDKITADDPVFRYVLTLTHTFYDLKHSMFIEHQGIKSDAYADGLFRGGAARLITKDFQVDAFLGINVKNTPSRIFGGIGASYRLDYHTDKVNDKRKRVDIKNVNPFDEEYNALDTLPKKERKRLRKQMRKEGFKTNDSIKNPFDLDETDEEENLTKAEKKQKRKQEIEERKQILDSLNQAFEEKREIQTQEILEREEETGGFFEDVDESKLSKKQLKELRKARKERAKQEERALKEEARRIKQEEKELLELQKEEEERLMREQEVEDQFFDDVKEDKPKKKKKKKKKKESEQDPIEEF
ncbi:transporter [Abyssalbus ytuae]|uniref:Transporter n=1 Tax=Abyssalbus ytuae TaxID=2926907 RepID=A0A9E7D1R2_9FLAO|nr:transporter [Abyssalbus ytuae]UOB17378.1 transporter [Abyssalbus ytuae]